MSISPAALPEWLFLEGGHVGRVHVRTPRRGLHPLVCTVEGPPGLLRRARPSPFLSASEAAHRAQNIVS